MKVLDITLYEFIKSNILLNSNITAEVIKRHGDIRNYVEKILCNGCIELKEEEGEIQGIVAYYCNDETFTNAFITLVLVSPDKMGKGIAGTLLDQVHDKLSKMEFIKCTLEVAKNNHAAMRLYTRKGYEVIEEKTDSYTLSCLISNR